MSEESSAGPESRTGLTIVLPALDLEGQIGTTIEALCAEIGGMLPALELIVVDDGSSDLTSAAVSRIGAIPAEVRLIRNRSNLGKGLAVYVGMLAARYSHVCFTDADLGFAPGSYARVIECLLNGADFVSASRRLPESEILVRMDVLGYAARRHFVGVSFNYFVRAALKLPFLDTQCGLKAFRREVAHDLFRRIREPRYLFDIELLLAAREIGVPVVEIPVCVAYNEVASSIRLARESVRMFAGLLQVRRRWRAGAYRAANFEMDPALVTALSEEIALARPTP